MNETKRRAALTMVEDAIDLLTRQRFAPIEQVTGKLNAIRKLLIAAGEDDG